MVRATHPTSEPIMNVSIAQMRRLFEAGIAFASLSVLAGCATTPPSDQDMRRLAEVTAIAGPTVSSFRYVNMSSFEPIGDRDLLIFTSPRSAWLLHLDGSCRDLEFDPFLGLTSSMGRVSSGFDKVIVRDNPIACRIEQIRPVDAAVLRHADSERKAQGDPNGAKSSAPVKASIQVEVDSGGR
jgi:hypothetical protein